MGVGLDRWGVGIPIAQLEEGHGLTAGDKDTAARNSPEGPGEREAPTW